MSNPISKPRLPDVVAEGAIELRAMHEDAWSLLEKMTPAQRRDAHKSRMRENDVPGFETSEKSQASRQIIAEGNAENPLNYDYWIIDKKSDRIVGTFSAFPTSEPQRPVCVSLNIYQKCNLQTYAPPALRIFTDHILRNSIVPAVCADAERGDTETQKALKSVGFTELPVGNSEFIYYVKYAVPSPTPLPKRTRKRLARKLKGNTYH